MRVFAELARTIESTDRWLKNYPVGTDRLADKLRSYLAMCRRTPEKWRSEKEAERTIHKIKNISTAILLIQYARGHDR